MQELYFDNNATTPLDEVVLERLSAALAENHGNPSSRHPAGERALAAVEAARAAVARLLGAAAPDEIVFTSGGTESLQTAMHFALEERSGGLVLTSATEHAATLQPLERWKKRGFDVRSIGVDREGRLATDELLSALAEAARAPGKARRVRLVTLIAANNETGVLLPARDVQAIAEATHAAGGVLHLDAVQLPGKRPLDVRAWGVDMVSVSAHKFHGPKGIGALYISGEWQHPLPGLLAGGPHEAERRAGTLNVPGIVGMGCAAERAQAYQAEDGPAGPGALEALRDRLERGLRERFPWATVHGGAAARLPNTTNLGFPGVDGELLHLSLAAEGLCVSGGAACSARSLKPSPVLLAMGADEDLARASVRFSLSRKTCPEEVEAALEVAYRVIGDLAGISARAARDPA